MICENIVNDHFYIGFTKAQILDLKKLSKFLNRCSFSKVKSGKDQWQGVYLYSNLGNYFEMIQKTENKNYGFGLAFSAFNKRNNLDVRKICDEFPKLKWKKEIRKLGKSKWFQALWISSPASSSSQVSSSRPNVQKNYSFFTWLMYYFPIERKSKLISSPSHIDRFCEISVIAPSQYLAHILENIKWMPDLKDKERGKNNRNKNVKNFEDKTLKNTCWEKRKASKLSFSSPPSSYFQFFVPNPDGSPLLFKITLDEMASAVQFQSIKMKLYSESATKSGSEIKLPELKYFTLSRKGNYLLLQSKKTLRGK